MKRRTDVPSFKLYTKERTDHQKKDTTMLLWIILAKYVTIKIGGVTVVATEKCHNISSKKLS